MTSRTGPEPERSVLGEAQSAVCVPVPSAWSALRAVNSTQWSAFVAAFLGWILDGFDFSILTFLLIEIQRSFTVDKALAGALGTVTLMFRLLGGMGAGTMADRYGRKLPLILSILWFSLFSLLSGFSTSYAMLFACRALFGIGMGGVWAAGIPLALEHWPDKLRGLASGLLQGGYDWGFILAAVIFQLLSPAAERQPGGWRMFFWVGALPALLVLWMIPRLQESPIWLARQRAPQGADGFAGISLLKIFQRALLGTTLQTSLLISICMFSYYSINFWYPTFLREEHLSPLRYVLVLHLGAIAGMAMWGRFSETRLGRRGAVTVAALTGVVAIPVYLASGGPLTLMLGALVMGLGGIGIWGMMPSYLTERFPTSVRGVGPGFAYHFGAAMGSFTPLVLGVLQDRGVNLVTAMSACITISGLLVVTVVWLGPETRGRTFTQLD